MSGFGGLTGTYGVPVSLNPDALLPANVPTAAVSDRGTVTVQQGDSKVFLTVSEVRVLAELAGVL